MPSEFSFNDLFSTFPDHTRLWIFATDLPMAKPQEVQITDKAKSFFKTWASHGRPVRAGIEVKYGQFLMIAAELDEGEISGCGIDALTSALKSFGESLGITWASPLDIFYADSDRQIIRTSRPDFKKLVEQEFVAPETTVFDLSITKVGELRGGRFVGPAYASWHGRVYGLVQAV